MGQNDMMATELIRQLKFFIDGNDGVDMEVHVWTGDQVKWKIEDHLDLDGLLGYETTTICIDAIRKA